MPSPTSRSIETDVCVVGAGLVGLAHALEARRRGLSVVVLEREHRALGASVRHDGHLFLSAAAGDEEAEVAAGARRRWLELAHRAGAFVERSGTLIVARGTDELALMESAVAERARHSRVLTRDQVLAAAPVAERGVAGGFHGVHDLRVDPRTITAALARLLMRDQRARIEYGMAAHDVEADAVHAGPLRVRAHAIVMCTGADQNSLPAAIRPGGATAGRVRRSQLLRIEVPGRLRLGPAIGNVLTLLDQPGFARLPAAEALRARLELERPEAFARGLRPLLTQLPTGDLVVGSTRTYSESTAPFSVERGDALLLEEVRSLLGIEPRVRERWTALLGYPGIGATATAAELGGDTSGVCGRHCADGHDGAFRIGAPLPTVRLVQSLSPLATAFCHHAAGRVLDDLLNGPEAGGGRPADEGRELLSPPGYVVVQDQRRLMPGGVRAHPEAFSARAPARA